MEKKSQNFSISEAKRLAKTPEGQKLMTLLQQTDQATLQKAMEAAENGNFKAAGQSLSALLSSPEAQQLIRQLGGKYGGL